jgi:hypothetical protein
MQHPLSTKFNKIDIRSTRFNMIQQNRLAPRAVRRSRQLGVINDSCTMHRGTKFSTRAILQGIKVLEHSTHTGIGYSCIHTCSLDRGAQLQSSGSRCSVTVPPAGITGFTGTGTVPYQCLCVVYTPVCVHTVCTHSVYTPYTVHVCTHRKQRLQMLSHNIF